jgi:hypothetical protein
MVDCVRWLTALVVGTAAIGPACGSDSGREAARSNGGTSASGGAGGVGGSTAGSAGEASGGSGLSSASGGSTSGGSSGNDASATGGSATTTTDSGFPDVNFSYDAREPVAEACASQTVQADPLPLDMYVMIDTSGSMGPSTPTSCTVTAATPATKLCRAVKALWGYFTSAGAAGNGVALQQFNSTGCSARSTPAVQMDALPNHLTPIQTWLEGLVNDGSTNTEGALLGLRDYTNPAVAPSPPVGFGKAAGRNIIGILITDGDPQGCQTSIGTLDDIIDDHFTSTQVRTYVIGMEGATFSNVENLADGAGAPPHTNYCGTSPPCSHYSVGAGDPAAFIDALNAIQQSAVGCTFNYPSPPSGVPDPTSLTVTYTPGSGSPATIPIVSSAAACGPSGGFYVNNPSAPTRIDLCTASCDLVKADSAARLDIEIACQGS